MDPPLLQPPELILRHVYKPGEFQLESVWPSRSYAQNIHQKLPRFQVPHSLETAQCVFLKPNMDISQKLPWAKKPRKTLPL